MSGIAVVVLALGAGTIKACQRARLRATVGAQKNQVLRVFLSEAIVLSALGGIAGLWRAD